MHPHFFFMRPLLILVHMPWFSPNPPHNMGHHGYTRIAALLYELKYACVLDGKHIKMIVLVQQNESEKCQMWCSHHCKCEDAEFDRAMAHNSIAKYATGERNILYTHADMWINLNKWKRLMHTNTSYHMMTPKMGLLGSNYYPLTQYHPRCYTSNVIQASREWFWHLNSKQICVDLSHSLQQRLFAKVALDCCYGWADLVYIPRRAHSAFKIGAHVFRNLQIEVAIPTILNAIQTTTRIKWVHINCAGGSLVRVPWRSLSHDKSLCAHKVPIHEPLVHPGVAKHLALSCKNVPPLTAEARRNFFYRL